MAAEIPTVEPEILVIGATWKWKRDDLSDYLPSDGWVLSYALRGQAGEIDITAAADGEAFLVNEAFGSTAGHAAGVYDWAAYVVNSTLGERHRVDWGRVKVIADLATETTWDQRTVWETILAACEAILTNKATHDHFSVEVAGRKLQHYTAAEILSLHDKAEAQIRADEMAEDLRRGDQPANKIYTRFTD